MATLCIQSFSYEEVKAHDCWFHRSDPIDSPDAVRLRSDDANSFTLATPGWLQWLLRNLGCSSHLRPHKTTQKKGLKNMKRYFVLPDGTVTFKRKDAQDYDQS